MPVTTSTSAAIGPFYCPADEHAYIDLSFYRELRQRFGAPGNFAQAYVLAHEIGHHLQKLLGIEDAHPSGGKHGATSQSVRLELQADCFAGVWGHSAQARGIVEVGDLETALTAAAAIGDDRLQKRTQGTIVPDAFTHGSSAQRQRWMMIGMKEGKVASCNTFAAGQV